MSSILFFHQHSWQALRSGEEMSKATWPCDWTSRRSWVVSRPCWKLCTRSAMC